MRASGFYVIRTISLIYLLCGCGVCSVAPAPAASPAPAKGAKLNIWDIKQKPNREDLKQVPVEQMATFLTDKGKSCKKCEEKEDFLDRIIKHWGREWKSATHPKSGARILRENFEKQFTDSLEKAKADSSAFQTLLTNIDLPTLWSDFAQKVRSGSIEIGKDGRTNYHVGEGMMSGMQDSLNNSWTGPWWRLSHWLSSSNLSDSTMGVMMVLNLIALILLNRMKSQERKKRNEERAKRAVEQKPIIKQQDIDEDDTEDAKNKHHKRRIKNAGEELRKRALGLEVSSVDEKD